MLLKNGDKKRAPDLESGFPTIIGDSFIERLKNSSGPEIVVLGGVGLTLDA